ncbi:YybH family protein [Gloeobacter morelensis]|uniref:DUF4440 domain-containing protein n=1 Tax=Gloeobacter morelensis MG652769 TaxID=2781736 RepID=A0ABY3PKS8_9CYAN|nr:hypothetical protein [Gloeobacter morelensis]UFP94277.1 DUF4440 domain-containing protein [Gloeobacter morelensis MG652769]
MQRQSWWRWTVAAIVVAGLLSVSAALAQGDTGQAVRSVLEQQASAWNRGDIPGFMAGYENAETTTFVGTDVNRGYQKVLELYLKRYPTPAAMGKLTFFALEILPLGEEYASALGQWKLERAPKDGGNVGGYFTLLLRKTALGWRIILDHTS